MLGFCALDQWVKWLVESSIPLNTSVDIAAPYLLLTHVQNTGIAFSMFNDSPQLLAWLTTCFFIGFLVYFLRNPMHYNTLLASLTFPLILGGALGNLIDRHLRGFVVDYIDVAIIQYPVFNLADAFICIGVGLFAFHILFKDNSTTNTHAF